MFIRFSEKLRNEDKGFTLIELMVVVLIIAILIAIAIPTFLGARRRAQDRAAQSSLRNSLTNAKASYSDNEVYPAEAALITDLTSAEPQLSFVASTADSVGPNSVSIWTTTDPSGNEFAGSVLSRSGTCFYLHDVAHGTGATAAAANPGVYYGSTVPVDGTPCTGSGASTASGSSW